MTATIPATILFAIAILLIVIGLPIAWWAWRWAWRWLIDGAAQAQARLMEAARARTRATVWPENDDGNIDSGDGGGHPMPSQRRAGDMTPGG